MSTIAAAAANPIRAMDAAASPLGCWLRSRPAAVTGWAAPFGTWTWARSSARPGSVAG